METVESANRGKLFVFEGVDGGGKTSVCDSVAEILRSEGHEVVKLTEPTRESQWGREIRERSAFGELTPGEELELFLRDREWHIKNRIKPALDAAKIVLMDRYFFASGAYQSTSTGLHWREILRRNREEIHAPEPDIVFILDLPVEVGLERVSTRKLTLNQQFEQYDRLVKVRQAYLEMVSEDSGRFSIIDATKKLKEVVDEVHQQIIEFLDEPPA
ncbi:MAG: dTMP kinase [Candidatus Thorarchaeota archaeon]|nr:MAG: dTMP kinase [Candidatus Thorarchaeota archaeon]